MKEQVAPGNSQGLYFIKIMIEDCSISFVKLTSPRCFRNHLLLNRDFMAALVLPLDFVSQAYKEVSTGNILFMLLTKHRTP